MNQALVFGKFLPFHKGHQAMIEFAAEGANRVLVCVCASQMESLPGKVRVDWIEETFNGRKEIEAFLLEYDESELPNTSVSSKAVSEAWANKFKQLFPEVDQVVTSEPYGEFVAEFMGIQHRPYNAARSLVPVSATMIRADIWGNWDYLPDPVKRFYQRKVVLLGTESSGKTMLSERLYRMFSSSLVKEAGRDVIPDSGNFTQDALYAVVEEHSRRVQTAMGELEPLVFIDTDLHITQSYAMFAFGRYMENIEQVHFEVQRGDLYLYLEADAPYVQDGTRLSPAERLRLDHCHHAMIKDYGLSVKYVNGDWDQRFEAAVSHVGQIKDNFRW